MITLSAFGISRLVADLAQDIWHKRDKLITPERDVLYLPFRLTVSKQETSENRDFYLHYVVLKDRWFYTLSDEAHMQMRTHDALLFLDSEADDPDTRGTSWRHYAFGDLLQPAIDDRASTIIKEFKTEDRVFLWNFFPLENIRFSTSAHDIMQRRRLM